MRERLLDILQETTEMPVDRMMEYLKGTLSPEDQNAVEQWLLDHPMEAEAIEGLQLVKDPARIPAIVHQLEHDLHKQLRSKKLHKKWILQEHMLIFLAAILVILLILATWFIIRMSQGN